MPAGKRENVYNTENRQTPDFFYRHQLTMAGKLTDFISVNTIRWQINELFIYKGYFNISPNPVEKFLAGYAFWPKIKVRYIPDLSVSCKDFEISNIQWIQYPELHISSKFRIFFLRILSLTTKSMVKKPGKIRLLVIEDNRLLREGISAMLLEQPDFKVVAALGAGEHLLEKIGKFTPNVVLLDLGLPSQNSLHLVESVKKKYPATKMIVMDLVPAQADIFEFVRAGISGFVLKDATTHHFLKTIRSVAQGTKVLPPLLTSSLFSQIVEDAINGPGKKISGVIDSIRMTKREKEVIHLVADGLTNKEIAHKLHLSIYNSKKPHP